MHDTRALEIYIYISYYRWPPSVPQSCGSASGSSIWTTPQQPTGSRGKRLTARFRRSGWASYSHFLTRGFHECVDMNQHLKLCVLLHVFGFEPLAWCLDTIVFGIIWNHHFEEKYHRQVARGMLWRPYLPCALEKVESFDLMRWWGGHIFLYNHWQERPWSIHRVSYQR